MACVSSIADYGIQLWWGKRKGTILNEYQPLQNSALQQILGAFEESLIKAMEIEAAVLPVKLRDEKLCNQYAIRTLTFAKLILFGKQCGNKDNMVFVHSWVSLQG
jgi:hypothetical protein